MVLAGPSRPEPELVLRVDSHGLVQALGRGSNSPKLPPTHRRKEIACLGRACSTLFSPLGRRSTKLVSAWDRKPPTSFRVVVEFDVVSIRIENVRYVMALPG